MGAAVSVLQRSSCSASQKEVANLEGEVGESEATVKRAWPPGQAAEARDDAAPAVDDSALLQPVEKSLSMNSTESTSARSTCMPLEVSMLYKEGAFGRQTSGASGPFGRQISSATSGCLYADAAQTLLFLDWDDTLFPTTALFETWGLGRDTTVQGLPEELVSLLEDWGAALKDFLTAACAMSERCIIVTNSKRPWVQTCIERFAPAAGLLDAAGEWAIGQSRLSVVYALEVAATKRRNSRSCVRPVLHEAFLEEEVTEHLMKAKQVSMQQEAKDFYSKYPGQTWKNLLSIGDMRYEHVALQEVTFRRVGNERERLRTKAITVPTSPSMGQISARLRCMKHLLFTCVHVDGDLSIDLEGEEEPLQKLGAALGLPDITRLTPLRCAWKEESAPSDEELTTALSDLARLVQKRFLHDF